MKPELATPSAHLKNYFLLFETYYGELLGWCIRTGIPVENIPSHIEAAADEWLETMEGIKHQRDDDLSGERHFDYAHALMNVPHMILAKYHIHLWTPIEEIIRLDSDINLTPEESKVRES